MGNKYQRLKNTLFLILSSEEMLLLKSRKRCAKTESRSKRNGINFLIRRTLARQNPLHLLNLKSKLFLINPMEQRQQVNRNPRRMLKKIGMIR